MFCIFQAHICYFDMYSRNTFLHLFMSFHSLKSEFLSVELLNFNKFQLIDVLFHEACI